MKTIKDLKNQDPVFINDWSDKIGIIADFENICMTSSEFNAEVSPYANTTMWEEDKVKLKAALEKHASENILFASYGQANYSGEAFVLFEKDGNLFEVNGSHCSCYGLEGQWEPEETSLDSLAHRLKEGDFGVNDWSDNNFRFELIKFLGIDEPPKLKEP